MEVDFWRIVLQKYYQVIPLKCQIDLKTWQNRQTAAYNLFEVRKLDVAFKFLYNVRQDEKDRKMLQVE